MLHELCQTTRLIAPYTTSVKLHVKSPPLHELRQTTCLITPYNTRAIQTLSTIPLSTNSIKMNSIKTCPITPSHKLHELHQTICRIAPLHEIRQTTC